MDSTNGTTTENRKPGEEKPADGNGHTQQYVVVNGVVEVVTPQTLSGIYDMNRELRAR